MHPDSLADFFNPSNRWGWTMIEKLEKQRNQEKSYEKKRTGFMVLFYFFNKKSW